MFSKKREIIIGGLKLSLNIRKGALETFEMGGRLYGKNDPIAKSFTKNFLSFLESQDGKNPVNFNNPLYKKDKELYSMLNKEQMSIRNGLNKFTDNLLDKKYLNFNSVAKEVMSSGEISVKRLQKIKSEMERPRGLKGILYKTLKGIVDFSPKDAVEKLAPSEFDIGKYTVKDYSVKKDASVQEVNADDIYKKMMLDFMQMMAETQSELLKTQKEFNEKMSNSSGVKADKQEEKTDVIKEEVVSAPEPSASPEKVVSKKELSSDEKVVSRSSVNFGSKEVKDDILAKWGESKKKNISGGEPSPEFLSINAIRFNGISQEKLNRWKENELNKKNPTITEDIANGYIAKNLAFAKVLTEIGILKEKNENEFAFSSGVAKEVLYSEYNSSVDEIRTAFSKAISASKDSKISNKSSASSNEEQKINLIKLATTQFKEFVGKNPTLVNEQDLVNFENYIGSLQKSNPTVEILTTELSSYIQGFVKNKSGIHEEAENEELPVFDTFEDFVKNSAEAAYNVGTDEAKLNEQKIASALVESELDKQLEKVEELEKKSQTATNPSTKIS